MLNNGYFAALIAYEAILTAFQAIPWTDEPDVQQIYPIAREHLEFFPGQKGYDGPLFPYCDGIMVVGNNFSSVQGWGKYRDGVDETSRTPTWKKLRFVIEESGLDLDRFYFTNFCLGVMHSKNESYNFPKKIVSRLKFHEFFAAFVKAMRPALIVTLGNFAAELVGTDFAKRERVDRRVIAGHTTKLMAIVHTSGWIWQG